ncbi:hypothetical protein STCU_10120 [Strigomonas culicis]|uniref:Helicase ATP-binding domain-containing protein n=1 Tax=Strigomonas culicis TaxID=28005 RepID=S9TJF0_9TRYP|nr:hypothetical protein STCU_10120 [Strigomonas culicis]|eukprot:EPY18202.1 hypothetical protein STCU_10120 [Strigomonas culicis]
MIRHEVLGGIATNPITETEAEYCQHQVGDEGGGEDAEEKQKRFQQQNSVGAVLYRQRNKYQYVSPSSSRRWQQQTHEGKSSAKEKHVDSDAAAAALTAPPNLRGDVILIDEAHNIADTCRQLSAAELSFLELRIILLILAAYLRRYEKRLLSRNKQKLREIIFFFERIVQYMTRRGGDDDQAVVIRSFADFVFEAGIDHIDVYTFLLFLAESNVVVKLKGMVNFVLELERAAAEEGREAKRSQRDASPIRQDRRRTQTTISLILLPQNVQAHRANAAERCQGLERAPLTPAAAPRSPHSSRRWIGSSFTPPARMARTATALRRRSSAKRRVRVRSFARRRAWWTASRLSIGGVTCTTHRRRCAKWSTFSSAFISPTAARPSCFCCRPAARTGRRRPNRRP